MVRIKDKVRFYMMYNKNTGDVEFVGSGNRLRMQDMLLRGYANIGSGECENLSELNRGICSNMRGMYEYQKRQNNELKIQLERALQKLKEVHRISGLGTGIQQSLSHSVTAPLTQESQNVRCQHMMFGGKQYRNVESLPLRERIDIEAESHHQTAFGPPPFRQGRLGYLVKEFWQNVN